MLDVSLEEVTFAVPRSRSWGPFSFRVERGTHTGIAGPSGAGKSLLLRAIEGTVPISGGTLRIGTRPANEIKASSRPILSSERHLRAPGWWSVRHVIVASMRQRTLSREERVDEINAVIQRWELTSLLDRSVRHLSTGERALVRIAQLDALHPGIVLLERIFAGCTMSDRPSLIDRTHRMLRGIGATVISELSGFDEIGVCQQLVVVEQGRITQRGIPSEIYARPRSLAAAAATGIFTEVPIEVSGTEVSSPIGHWEVEAPPFNGSGIAIARPSAFAVAAPGEESDCLFAIEEAEFVDGRWRARGILSGASMLAIELPAESVVRKGKLLPLRYDPRSFVLLPREREAHPTAGAIPIDVIPPMRESR